MERYLRITLFIGFVFFFSSGKAQERNTDTHTIYVSSISWHTGVVVPAYALPDSLWGNGLSYDDNTYLEIGWGDADFFPHDRFNIWYALKAVFWPTASVIHVNPIHQSVEDYYYDSGLVRIEMDDEQLHQLVLYLIEEFELDPKRTGNPRCRWFLCRKSVLQKQLLLLFPKQLQCMGSQGHQKSRILSQTYLVPNDRLGFE